MIVRSKSIDPYFSVRLFSVPSHLAAWMLERVPGSRISGKLLPKVSVTFVRPDDACNALVHAYPYLLQLKEPAQIYFKFVKLIGRQGSRMTKKQRAEREALAERLAACRRGA